MPAIYQQGSSCPPADDWTQFSLIRIQNPTENDATDVDIRYYDENGNLTFEELNFSIDAGESFNRNTRVHCGDIPLGLSWTGSAVISSDIPLVAVVETQHTDANNWMASYNGVSR